MIINPITVIKSLKVLKPLCTVSAGIDPDLDRFRDILRGKAREELKKFKNPGEMAAIKGGKLCGTLANIRNTLMGGFCFKDV